MAILFPSPSLVAKHSSHNSPLSCQVLFKEEFVNITSAINYTEYVTNSTIVVLKIDIQAKAER